MFTSAIIMDDLDWVRCFSAGNFDVFMTFSGCCELCVFVLYFQVFVVSVVVVITIFQAEIYFQAVVVAMIICYFVLFSDASHLPIIKSLRLSKIRFQYFVTVFEAFLSLSIIFYLLLLSFSFYNKLKSNIEGKKISPI